MAHIWGLALPVFLMHLRIGSAQVAPSNVDCSGLPAGTRMWGCKAYHECQADGSSAYVECGFGHVYSELTGNCEHYTTVDTPCGRSYRRECRDYGPPFGKIAVKDYVDHQTGLPCQYFFTCANGHFYGTQKCEGFQVFNEVLQYCVKPEAAPTSCNPFGPQAANVQEVKRHWWKSDTAGGKVRTAKQPWWKAKNSQGDVAKAVVKQKHWLTRSAAARLAKSMYPKFEKMLVKGKAKVQEIASRQRKVLPSRRKSLQIRKKLVHPSTKRVPTTKIAVTTTTKEKIVSSKKIFTEEPSRSSTTVTSPSETNRTATSTSTSTLTHSTAPSPQADHPWNAKGKTSSRSIVPKEKSPSSSTS